MLGRTLISYYILMQVFENMDKDLKVNRKEHRVYFSNDKLYSILGFQFSLSKKGTVIGAYRNGRKLNNRNATNILHTLNRFTEAYFDFKDRRFHCLCKRATWNYSSDILIALEQEAEKLFNVFITDY